jgi:hypothetical protein
LAPPQVTPLRDAVAAFCERKRRARFLDSEYSVKGDEELLDGLRLGLVRIIVDAGIP